MHNSQIDNVKLEQKLNSTTKDEVYSVCPSIAKPNVSGCGFLSFTCVCKPFFVICRVAYVLNSNYFFSLSSIISLSLSSLVAKAKPLKWFNCQIAFIVKFISLSVYVKPTVFVFCCCKFFVKNS